MVIRRVDPVSAAKVLGICSACFGFLIGAMFSLFALALGGMMATASDEAAAGGALFGTLMGAGAIIIMPIFYGIFGFIGGLIYAFIFNLAAKWTGGLVVDAS